MGKLRYYYSTITTAVTAWVIYVQFTADCSAGSAKLCEPVATQAHCYNPVAPSYPTWAYYANADAKRILLASPLADWRRQLGRPRITWLSTVQQDLKQHHLTLPEAADLAQNRPLWRMMSTYGATQSQSCMPETTTTWRRVNAVQTLCLDLLLIEPQVTYCWLVSVL